MGKCSKNESCHQWIIKCSNMWAVITQDGIPNSKYRCREEPGASDPIQHGIRSTRSELYLDNLQISSEKTDVL